MKYIVLLGDGMADYPIKEQGGKTPLEIANIPNMNWIARNGQVGIVKTVPDGFVSGSDITNLSLLGYDPVRYYKGRGPLEACNMGVKLDEGDVAFRCNLITVKDDILLDYSAGHISNEDAAVLIRFIDEKLGSDKLNFYPGVSYRHLMVVRKGLAEADKIGGAKCIPPHSVPGAPYKGNLPTGAGSEFLIYLMEKAHDLLNGHELNEKRIQASKRPGNMIWLWGQGLKPDMPLFKDKYGIEGAVISAVDLIKGIGKLIGLKVIDVPGATGYYDTNYKGKAEHGLKSLEEGDFIFIHVEAPDEAGHSGILKDKVKAIEDFDAFVVGRIVEECKKRDDFKVLVLPDHATPLSIKDHAADPVPFAVFGKGTDSIESYSEKDSKKSNLFFDGGYKLIEWFIKGGE